MEGFRRGIGVNEVNVWEMGSEVLEGYIGNLAAETTEDDGDVDDNISRESASSLDPSKAMEGSTSNQKEEETFHKIKRLPDNPKKLQHHLQNIPQANPSLSSITSAFSVHSQTPHLT